MPREQKERRDYEAPALQVRLVISGVLPPADADAVAIVARSVTAVVGAVIIVPAMVIGPIPVVLVIRIAPVVMATPVVVTPIIVMAPVTMMPPIATVPIPMAISAATVAFIGPPAAIIRLLDGDVLLRRERRDTC